MTPLLAADLPVSDKATDPSSWATLVERIGVGGFFALVFFLLFATLTVFALRWTLGADGFIRVGMLRLFGAGEALVADLRAGLADLQREAKEQAESQRREQVSNEQLRAAGVHFARMGGAIGEKIGADVGHHVEAITRTLGPPPAAA